MKKRISSIVRFSQARLLYLATEHGLTDDEVASHLHVSRTTAYRIRVKLACSEITPHRYGLEPTPSDIDTAKAILARAKK